MELLVYISVERVRIDQKLLSTTMLFRKNDELSLAYLVCKIWMQSPISAVAESDKSFLLSFQIFI